MIHVSLFSTTSICCCECLAALFNNRRKSCERITVGICRETLVGFVFALFVRKREKHKLASGRDCDYSTTGETLFNWDLTELIYVLL